MRETLEDEEESEKINTTPPSIIDTDAEESDSGEIIKGVHELNTNEISSGTSSNDVNEVKPTSIIASMEERNLVDSEDCEALGTDEPVAKQSFRTLPDFLLMTETRSRETDEPTDDSNTCLTRGGGAKSRLGLEPSTEDDSSKENKNKDSFDNTVIPCHPSKLAHQRGDSLSTLQPDSLEQHGVSPDFRVCPAGSVNNSPEFSNTESENHQIGNKMELIGENDSVVSFVGEETLESCTAEEETQIIPPSETEEIGSIKSSQQSSLDVKSEFSSESNASLETSPSKACSLVTQSQSQSSSNFDMVLNHESDLVIASLQTSVVNKQSQDDQDFMKHDGKKSDEGEIEAMPPSKRDESSTDLLEAESFSTMGRNESMQEQNISRENNPTSDGSRVETSLPPSGRVTPSNNKKAEVELDFGKKDGISFTGDQSHAMISSEKEGNFTNDPEDLTFAPISKNEIVREQNAFRENSPTRIHSSVEVGQPASGRATPFSQHEGFLNLESNIVIAPPTNMIIQQSQGEQKFYPNTTLQHHGSFGYTQVHPSLQVPVVQKGISSNISAMQQIPASVMSGAPTGGIGGGRRKISLKLEEDAKYNTKRSFFFRRKSSPGGSLQSIEEPGIDRGTITVSWFEGTSTSELQEHVKNSVMRKLHIDSATQLIDIRIMDRSEDPPQEIVLSPFIPDGSQFVLRFSSQRGEKLEALPSSPPRQSRSALSSTPVSPSAAPSPYPSNVDLSTLNAKLLSGKLDRLKPPLSPKKSSIKHSTLVNQRDEKKNEDDLSEDNDAVLKRKVDDADTASKASEFNEDDVMGYNPEDQIEARLRQLADLLIADRKSRRSERRTKEKRQVVFVIINYLGFFLALIALSAELSARAPEWLRGVENHFKNVQKCSKDQDALFECVSEGDFAGLVASFVLWLSRSSATKTFFLFGFETPKKLWTVVYESLVTALCWGASYILIRRGMNPDTRSGFVRKYWKDAVYGSLAGFNASFMKQVLKNLIPQEALEDALQERQLKILSWLPSFH